MARVDRSGREKNGRMHGVMYCLIHNNHFYALHTQDYTIQNGKFLQQGITAIESLVLNPNEENLSLNTD